MRLLWLAGLVLTLTPCSFADTIFFTETGVGSGTIGATPFTGAAFTFTETGDTSNRTPLVTAFYIPDATASVSISGVGTFTMLVPFYTFLNGPSNIVGFGELSGGVPAGDLLQGPTNAAFATWDMLSSIGPIGGTANLLQWTTVPNPVNTSGGVLVFDNGSSDTVFTATVVPEPASVILILTALVLCFGFRKSLAKV